MFPRHNTSGERQVNKIWENVIGTSKELKLTISLFCFKVHQTAFTCFPYNKIEPGCANISKTVRRANLIRRQKKTANKDTTGNAAIRRTAAQFELPFRCRIAPYKFHLPVLTQCMVPKVYYLQQSRITGACGYKIMRRKACNQTRQTKALPQLASVTFGAVSGFSALRVLALAVSWFSAVAANSPLSRFTSWRRFGLPGAGTRRLTNKCRSLKASAVHPCRISPNSNQKQARKTSERDIRQVILAFQVQSCTGTNSSVLGITWYDMTSWSVTRWHNDSPRGEGGERGVTQPQALPFLLIREGLERSLSEPGLYFPTNSSPVSRGPGGKEEPDRRLGGTELGGREGERNGRDVPHYFMSVGFEWTS